MYSWAIAQLKQRSKVLSDQNRTEDQINYIGNKGAWIRVVSSANLEDSFIKYFNQQYTDISILEDALAKNFILFGGTSTYQSKLRSGINLGGTYADAIAYGTGGSYAMLGDKEVNEYGYRAMPGITSVTVESAGRMGSLKQATVNFRVSDKMQLDIMDALYFRPGFTLLIEYGHAKYIDNNGNLQSTEELMIDPFEKTDKEKIAIEISKKIKESAGNYGGMLSIITSFNFSITPDGGYDCVLKTIAMGGVMGNYPINNLSTLPDIYVENIQRYINNQKEIDIQTAREAAEKTKADALAKVQKSPNDNWSDLGIGDPLANLIYNINPSFFQIEATAGGNNRNPLTGDLIYTYDANLVTRAVNKWKQDNVIESLNTEAYRVENSIFIGQNALVIESGPNTGPVGTVSTGKYLATSKLTNKQRGDIYVNVDPARIFQVLYTADERVLDLGLTIDVGPITSTNWFDGIAVSTRLSESDDEELIGSVVYTSNFKEYAINIFYPRNKRVAAREIYLNPETRWKVIDINANSPFIKLETKTKDGTFQLYLGSNSIAGDLSFISNIIEEGTNQDLKYNKPAEEIAQIERQFQQTVANITTNADVDADATTLRAVANSQSALELMLRSINLWAIDDSPSSPSVDNFFKSLFSEGAYSSIFANGIPEEKSYSLDDFKSYKNGTMNAKDRLEINLRYGNSAYLMSAENTDDKTNLLKEIPQVDFYEILKVNFARYGKTANIGIPNPGDSAKFSVYIPLGLFFLMLNHTGLLYGNNEEGDTLVPLTYIDFNPSTNFYLSSVNQFSVDPFKFILPFRGSQNDYKKLFKKEVLQPDDTIKLEIPGSTVQPHPIFDFSSGADQISYRYPNNKKGLKGTEDGYIGRTMEVMVNVDYLLDIIKKYSTADDFGETYFQSIIENIIGTFNKSTGYYNAFRLSYSDSANVYMIVDDHIQLKPDATVQTAVSNIITNTSSPEIPIQGAGSIARSFDIRTDISSRIASMIAISTNPSLDTQVGMGKNTSDFGIYNAGSYDRYIKRKTSDASSNANQTAIQNNVQECQAAIDFDMVVSSIYGFANNVESDSISDDLILKALSYYKERMSRIKNEQPGSVAAMIIPIKASITMDGFSGVYPFQLFTINENMLPYRYSSANLNNGKVAFSTARITHNFSNNEWVTSMEGFMTFLNSSDVQTIEPSTQPSAPVATINSFTAEEGLAKTAAEEYLGRTISLADWTLLIRATFGESTSNQKEQAYVMAAILNRVRTNYNNFGTNISTQLYAKRQFQAVTGTVPKPGPNKGFRDGPDASAAESLYGGVVTYLKTADKSITNFTSNSEKAYGRGTDINYLYTLRANPKSVVIGGTIFSPKI